MKKIYIILNFVILIATFSLTSCNVEPLDPALSGQVNSGSGNGSGSGSGGNTGGGTGSGGTSSGDYWPTAINNIWHYESSSGAPVDPIKIIGTTAVNGQTYYTFAPQSGSGTTTSGTVTNSLNKNSGVYKLKTNDFTINAGGITGTQTGFEFIILKDNIATGGTWNGSYSQTTTYTGIPAITMNTTYSGVILAKGVSEIVDGETYSNVIKVKVDQTASFSGAPATTISTEYWFAKDVGVIKSMTTTNGSVTTSILVDYTLF